MQRRLTFHRPGHGDRQSRIPMVKTHFTIKALRNEVPVLRLKISPPIDAHFFVGALRVHLSLSKSYTFAIFEWTEGLFPA